MIHHFDSCVVSKTLPPSVPEGIHLDDILRCKRFM